MCVLTLILVRHSIKFSDTWKTKIQLFTEYMLFLDKKENIGTWKTIGSTRNSYVAYRINCWRHTHRHIDKIASLINICYAIASVQSALHTLSFSNLTIAPWDKYYSILKVRKPRPWKVNSLRLQATVELKIVFWIPKPLLFPLCPIAWIDVKFEVLR